MWKEEAKETIIRFGDETSLQGVPFIIRARNRPVRLFWGLIVFLSCGMVIFMLTLLVLQYQSYPVMVDVSQVGIKLFFPLRWFCSMFSVFIWV